ncbi:Arb2 domain-containing protein [Pyrenochaeta sp. MPI-SDFR-AT-0127]|nr:Arb2 domain-containing protein [Pyrenochaeta sp. MPI-SDFR-AT-0127]
MFRRIENTLEPDPSFAADLNALGLSFFINKVGQIRMIEAPEEPYIFRSTNNDRVNEVRQEAMRVCQREEAEKRLTALGVTRFYLPSFSTKKPIGPHIPILTSPPEILKTRKRVIVLINDSFQDLGILAYGQLQRELGINGGSVVNFVKEIIKRSGTDDAAAKYNDIFEDGQGVESDNDIPALVVLNTGQLLYSHKYNQAMTLRSWSAMARKSVVHDMIQIHDDENRVEGHRNPKDHIKSVFDNILCNPDRVASNAEIYIVAIENGTENMLDLLTDNFEKYGSRITGMALIHSLVDASQIKNVDLRAFLHQRARQWKCSDFDFNPLHCTDLPEHYSKNVKDDTHQGVTSTAKATKHICWTEEISKPSGQSQVTNTLQSLALTVKTQGKEIPASALADTSTEWPTGQAVICPTYAGGNAVVGECIFTSPTVQRAILSFFEEIAQDPEHFRNPNIKIHTETPQPTLDNPLLLSADEAAENCSIPAPETTSEQVELAEAREKLSEMRIALGACPANVQVLEKGREKLVRRIEHQEAEIEDLEKKMLASGGLKAGEAQDKRENWKPQKEGPKVEFAGAMVDSELLKAAGLFDTAKLALDKLGGGKLDVESG